MLWIIAMAVLVSASAAASSQAGFHVGVRVVSSARVAAAPSAQPDRIHVEAATRGTRAPLVVVGDKGGWVPASGEVNMSPGSADGVVVTFLY
jgi:hypothetical protein